MCGLHIAFMMKAVSFPESSVTIHSTTQHNILEDSILRTHHHENLKSHIVKFNISTH
jgi:hypothetical protein